jgi:hypothetical protein
MCLWNFVSHLRGKLKILRVFENRVLRRLSGPKRGDITRWENSIMRNFIICCISTNIRMIK